MTSVIRRACRPRSDKRRRSAIANGGTPSALSVSGDSRDVSTPAPNRGRRNTHRFDRWHQGPMTKGYESKVSSRQSPRDASRSRAMDHESALQAANQALSGGALRSTSRFASVELRGAGELKGTGRGMTRDESSSLPNGAWELAAMLSVGVATLLLVLAIWFL